MTETYKYETEARIIMDALTAGVQGKGHGTLMPDMAGLRYEVEGRTPIAVLFVNGTIVAKSEGKSTMRGASSLSNRVTRQAREKRPAGLSRGSRRTRSDGGHVPADPRTRVSRLVRADITRRYAQVACDLVQGLAPRGFDVAPFDTRDCL
jgi:hypothetical protein